MVRDDRTHDRRDACRPHQTRDQMAPRLRAGWLAILLVTLLAFAGQCFVTQTHVHFAPGSYPAAIAARIDPAQRHAAIVAAASDQSDECPICDEIAHSGHVLLPTSIVLPAPERNALLPADTPSFAQLPPARSHAWQSRAPPLQTRA